MLGRIIIYRVCSVSKPELEVLRRFITHSLSFVSE